MDKSPNKKLYSFYDKWKKWENIEFGSLALIDTLYFASEIKRAGYDEINKLKVYEIGFGNGDFYGFACSNGCLYYGSEINTQLIIEAKACGVNVVDGGIKQLLGESNNETFDMVVAFDVLEHLTIEEILVFLKDAHDLLRPGGTLIARVPSGDSPFGRAILYGDITHRTALGSSSVEQLAMQANLYVYDIGPPSYPIFGAGIKRSVRRFFIKTIQSFISFFINIIFNSGKTCVITPNMVFILKKLELD